MIMEREDKERTRKPALELKKWANESKSRCLLIIASDKERGFYSIKYSSYLQMGEAIANVIHRTPDLISAMKIAIAAAEDYNRQKEEKKKNKS